LAKLLIIGASRGIGLEATKRALDLGHSVRAMSRRATEIPINHPHLDKYSGDALVASDVDGALDGIEAVIQSLGVDLRRAVQPRPVRLFSKSSEVLVQAMQRQGVGRLIAVTGYGAGDSRARQGCLESLIVRAVLGRAYADKDRQELVIRHSPLDWVIARPVVLTPGPRTGRYRVLDDPKDWRPGFISRADVADFLVRQVDDDSYLGRCPVLSY
jgi:putative NADH-flavin reductase